MIMKKVVDSIQRSCLPLEYNIAMADCMQLVCTISNMMLKAVRQTTMLVLRSPSAHYYELTNTDQILLVISIKVIMS